VTQESHRHGLDEQLCKAGMTLYTRALREGRIAPRDADEAPCVMELGLLFPDGEGMRWLRPLAPSIALPRLLQSVEEDIARRRRNEVALADAFQPLMAMDAENSVSRPRAMMTLLHGLQPINTAIHQAITESSKELLTVQPGGFRPPAELSSVLSAEQSLLGRGGRMRTLYQHSSRHAPAVLDHFEQLEGNVEVRTLHEVTERLVILDRRVAFIPANSDRTTALVLRHPALVGYLATMFSRLWDLATPMWPRPGARPPADKGVTSRQRAIAALLIEGLTDDKIALRLAMNVRTVRLHIAKLADALGTSSRAQLGYRIGQSGILEEGS
jgi:DNA-binding CsgD family transcriptional regulator